MFFTYSVNTLSLKVLIIAYFAASFVRDKL